jgi:hypothetical protein
MPDGESAPIRDRPTARAGAPHDLAELILDDVFVGVSNRALPRFFELCNACFVAMHRLSPGEIVGPVGSLHFLERDLLGGVVGRADRVGSFEGHVLEHVRETGDPRLILRRACIDEGVEGEDRRFSTDPRSWPIALLMTAAITTARAAMLRAWCIISPRWLSAPWHGRLPVEWDGSTV